MGYYNITGITAKLNSIINGNLDRDHESYRFLHLLESESSHKQLTLFYSLAEWKTYDEDEKRRRNISRLIKLGVSVAIGPGLITPVIEKSSNTYCELVINILDVKDGITILKYDNNVCNGSLIHKKMVAWFEKTAILWNLRGKDGIEINEPYVKIDFKRAGIPDEYRNLTKVQSLYFKGDSCIYFV